MNYKTLKNTARNYALALGILGSSVLPLSGCNFAKANPSNQSTEQEYPNSSSQDANQAFFYRHPGMKNPNGGLYIAEQDGDSYEDASGKKYFSEERMIKSISVGNNVIEYNLSDLGSGYAEKNNCELNAILIDTKNDSDPSNDELRFDIKGGLDENRAEFEIPGDNPALVGLRAGVYCIDNQKPVILASYPIGNSSQVYPPSQVAGPQTSYTKIEKPVKEPEDRPDIMPQPKKGLEPIKKGGQETKTYQPGELNRNDEYRLRTDCGEIKSVRSLDGTEYPTDMFGLVSITDDKTCSIYLDEEDNSFNTVDFEPENDLENIIYSRSADSKKVTVSFKQPNQYVLIAGTDKHDEKDILVFDVNPVLNLGTGSLDILVDSTEGPSEQKLSLEYIIANIGTDPFNAKVLVKPFLRTRINATENPVYKKQTSINQALKAEKKSELELAKLKKSRFGRKLIVLDKDRKGNLFAQDNNVLNTKLEFGYKQKKVGVNGTFYGIPELTLHQNNSVIVIPEYVDGINYQKSLWKVKDNEYLYVLEGYDKDKKLVDIDALLIEINANLIKEYMRGFGSGAVFGLATGGLAGYDLGFSKARDGAEIIKIVKDASAGTKTGGNIPIQK